MRKVLAILVSLALFWGTASSALAVEKIAAGKVTAQKLQMTQEQKDKMISLKIQMLELKKQIVEHNLKNGTISQEQAQRLEARINQRLEQLKAGKLEGKHHRKHSPKS